MLECLGNMPIEVLNGEDSYWCFQCKNGIHNHPYYTIGYRIVYTCINKSYNGQGMCRCLSGNKDIK